MECTIAEWPPVGCAIPLARAEPGCLGGR